MHPGVPGLSEVLLLRYRLWERACPVRWVLCRMLGLCGPIRPPLVGVHAPAPPAQVPPLAAQRPGTIGLR